MRYLNHLNNTPNNPMPNGAVDACLSKSAAQRGQRDIHCAEGEITSERGTITRDQWQLGQRSLKGGGGMGMRHSSSQFAAEN